MKPGDLVEIVSTPAGEHDYVGLIGMIVSAVTLEDGHPINSWCDWWVLIQGELEPWEEAHLRVVDETR